MGEGRQVGARCKSSRTTIVSIASRKGGDRTASGFAGYE